MKKNLLLILFAVAVIAILADQGLVDLKGTGTEDVGSGQVATAYENREQGAQVEGTGVVSRILPDDDDGSRHQRFILRLDNGQTVLVAHNIDLAPRIASVREGDTVAFYGEYEWNSRGGVIHWTHHDPAGRHVGGWLEHGGRRYE
ncbi:MAG: DUF3465 domain-containing protein [Pseudomonadota bacterium]